MKPLKLSSFRFKATLLGSFLSFGLAALAQDAPPVPSSHKFPYLGVADGWQERLEGVPGRVFESVAGNPVDGMRYMAANGFNAVRVTVENQQQLASTAFQNGTVVINGQNTTLNSREGNYELDYQGVDLQVDIARRAKANGMKVVLTIDFASQTPIPESWINYTYAQMLTAIDSETRTLLDPFLQAGIQPDVVIASNESNGGTLNTPPSGSTDTDGVRSLSNTAYYSDGTDTTKINAVFGTLATGDASIWVKCAGFYKESILAVKSELSNYGFNPSNTLIGLHSSAGGDPIAFYKRIFAPTYPDQESVYYPGDPANPQPGNGQVVTVVPANLRTTRLSTMVDIMGISEYPGAPTAQTNAAYNTAVNTERPDGGCGALNSTLSGLQAYTSGFPNLKGLILEFGVPYGTNQTVQTQEYYATYVLNEISTYAPFMLGALWWEGEYAQFQPTQRLFLPGPFYTSYNGNPSYDDSPVYQATPTLLAWGEFGQPASNLSYTLTSAPYTDVLQSGAYTGSWSGVQSLESNSKPTLSDLYQIGPDANGYSVITNLASGFPLSPWNSSTTPGDHVTQTSVASPPLASQEWILQPPVGGGSQQIINHNSMLALDVPQNGSGLQDTVSSATSQQWLLTPPSRYNLVNVASGSVADSGLQNIYTGQYVSMQASRQFQSSQQWQLIDDGNGYYRIVSASIYSTNANAALLLAPWNNATSVGANIEQTPLGSPIQPGQEWQLHAVGSNYQLINRNSGLALDAPNNTTVVQDTPNSSNTQLWSLPLVPSGP